MKSVSGVTLLVLFTIGFRFSAQVPRNIVVEHFTNTNCGVCASRNPGFYTNLSSQPGVLHIAFHPSSPYPACLLNQHNKPENDGRTNYYGIFGATPRLVIQGNVISSGADYSASSIFDPYKSQVSPIELSVRHFKFGSDTIAVRVVARSKVSHNLGVLRLFVALVEDTVFYASPNGESLHHDVFRKSLADVKGVNFMPVPQAGDSSLFYASVIVSPAWNLNRIYALAILQDSVSKSVIQAGSSQYQTGVITGISKIEPGLMASIYPNPSDGTMTIHCSSEAPVVVIVSDLLGNEVLNSKFSNGEKIDLNGQPKGIYVFRVITGEYQKNSKVVLD